MSERRLLNIVQAADYCGLPRTTFLRLVSEKRIPPGYKLGPRARRWKREELDTYIESCRIDESAA